MTVPESASSRRAISALKMSRREQSTCSPSGGAPGRIVLYQAFGLLCIFLALATIGCGGQSPAAPPPTLTPDESQRIGEFDIAVAYFNVESLKGDDDDAFIAQYERVVESVDAAIKILRAKPDAMYADRSTREVMADAAATLEGLDSYAARYGAQVQAALDQLPPAKEKPPAP